MLTPLPCPVGLAADRLPDQAALAWSGGQLSYRALDRMVGRPSEMWRRIEVDVGDRVGLLTQTDVGCVIAFWTLLRKGATVCPLNPRWPAAAVDEAVCVAAIDRLLAAEDWSSWRHWADERPGRRGREPLDQGLARHDRLQFRQHGDPQGDRPRTVVPSGQRGSNQNLPLRPGDRWLLSLPLFHVSGIGILFRCAMAGATVAIPSQELSLRAQIQQHQPTHLSLVPTQLSRLMDQQAQPPASLRAVLLGGGPLPSDLIRRASAAGWPLATTYGLSEMASQVTTTAAGAGDDELRTAGHVLAGRELKIGDDREILVRGETLFRGYVQQRDMTRPSDADGWFHTGDLGCWDAAGRLIVIGRRDNLFISGGENIYPEEIELVLLDLPGVRQALVVPIASQQYGQRPVAYIDGDHAHRRLVRPSASGYRDSRFPIASSPGRRR